MLWLGCLFWGCLFSLLCKVRGGGVGWAGERLVVIRLIVLERSVPLDLEMLGSLNELGVVRREGCRAEVCY